MAFSTTSPGACFSSSELQVFVRGPKPSDFNDLVDIDLKTFELPWSPQEWHSRFTTRAIAVATWYGKPVGFAMGHCVDERFHLEKIAVREQYRRRGIGKRLLETIEDYGREHDCWYMVITVPEHVVYETGVGSWFTRTGFRADKVVSNEFEYYGEDESGIRFRKSL